MQVRVDDGWSVSRIGDELVDRDVIGSSVVLNVYTRLKDRKDFQAGTYELRKDMGVRNAVSALEAGPRSTTPSSRCRPGCGRRRSRSGSATSSRAGPRTRSSPRCAAAPSVRSTSPRASTSLEGLLWPDTYRIADTDDEIDVLGTMVSEFEKNADALGLENATTEGHTPYEILTVASLIEAEAKVDEDRPLIASVIYNRLRMGMPLQIDATVLYASGDPTKQTITQADLDKDSPYNTYKVKGLPPTPIANVSEASLKAALAPAQTDYLYYVIGDKDGRHKFAETYAEQQANIDAARAAGPAVITRQ